jgi:hypothetical protein
MFFIRSWSDFDPQAYTLYGEDQNNETSFKGEALQAAVDSWCKIQVLHGKPHPSFVFRDHGPFIVFVAAIMLR